MINIDSMSAYVLTTSQVASPSLLSITPGGSLITQLVKQQSQDWDSNFLPSQDLFLL